MPSFVMLPFIQCHHTRGFADFGGVIKLEYKLSFGAVNFAWEKLRLESSKPKQMNDSLCMVVELSLKIEDGYFETVMIYAAMTLHISYLIIYKGDTVVLPFNKPVKGLHPEGSN